MLDLTGNFFGNLLNFIFTVVGYFMNIILTPINLIITNLWPGSTDVLSSVNNFFDKLVVYANWFLSYTGMSTATVDLLILMWTAILTIPVASRTIKFAILWFKTLKVG